MSDDYDRDLEARDDAQEKHDRELEERTCCGECGWDDDCDGCCLCLDGHA